MKLAKDNTPETLDRAIEECFASLKETERAYILNTEDHVGLHHNVGQFMRNTWNFWVKDTPFKKHLLERYGIFGHGDDCSSLVLTGLWAKVRGNDVDAAINEEVANIKRHWEREEIDILTGEPTGIPPTRRSFTFKDRNIIYDS